MDKGLPEPAERVSTLRMEGGQSKEEQAQLMLDALRRAVIAQGTVYLSMGHILTQFKEQKLYRHLGSGGYDSFHQFLGGPDVSISQSTAYALIAIYNRYVMHFGFTEESLSDIPWYKLHMLSSVDPKDKPDAEEWIEKARTLGPSDFRTEVNETKANKGHDHLIPYPNVYRCKDCSLWRYDGDPQYDCRCVRPAH